jgi:hypothetical protein
MTTSLTDLDSSSNQLMNFDVKNGNNATLLNLDIQYNPDLWCVLVDDIDLAGGYTTWLKDSTALYKLECVDNDDDGVPNDIDNCPNTPFGEDVDLFGCTYFSLPASNFTILITGETCITSNNGKINITAQEYYNYTATVTGARLSDDYNFTEAVDIRNLLSGTYELCIKIEEQPTYNICYTIIITEPQKLSVLSRYNSLDKNISLGLFGGKNYTIDFNGLIYTTTESEITLSVSKGNNSIEIKTDLECQGVYKENIFVSDEISIYPNPFEERINVFMGNNDSEKVALNIYSYLGQLVLSKKLLIKEDFINIDTSNIPSGLYIVSLESNNSLLTFKIVKK